TTPRHGIQTLGSPYEANRSQAARRDGTRRFFTRSSAADHSFDHFFRSVRISRVSRCQLRTDCLCQRLSEMSLPGCLHCCHAEQSTHGLLSSGHNREGRATPWAESAVHGCTEVRLVLYVGKSSRRASTTSGSTLCPRVA